MARKTQPAISADLMVGGLCVLASLVLLLLPDHAQIRTAHALASVLVNPWLEVRNFGEDVLSVRADNEKLAAQVLTLELQLAAARRREADLARDAGPALVAERQRNVAPCRVIARKRVRQATMIQVRSREPLAWHADLPVLTSRGVIGRLHTIIDPHAAWVELLSAPDVALGVEFERTGLVGVLRPRADRFVVELVGRDEDVLPGDMVVTAGIAEVRREVGGPLADPVPRGLPVGVVSQVAAPSEAIFKDIDVQPLAEFTHNETVFVVGATPLPAGTSPQDGARADGAERAP